MTTELRWDDASIDEARRARLGLGATTGLALLALLAFGASRLRGAPPPVEQHKTVEVKLVEPEAAPLPPPPPPPPPPDAMVPKVRKGVARAEPQPEAPAEPQPEAPAAPVAGPLLGIQLGTKPRGSDLGDPDGDPNGDPRGSRAGSPDRDKDGVVDPIDACPDVPGVASGEPGKNGCPAPAPPPKPAGPVQLPENGVPAECTKTQPVPTSEVRNRLESEVTVVVRYAVDASGAVSSVNVVRGDALVNDVVTSAVKSWRCKAATVEGQPIATYQTHKFKFRPAE